MSDSSESRGKILIVEDDPMYLDIYETKLVLDGYTVVKAEDGLAGLEMAKKEMPDAILLDIMLPKLNGQDVLKELKKDPDTRNITVIMLSVLDQEKQVNDAIESGATCYLVKSNLTPAAVISEMERCIDKGKVE